MRRPHGVRGALLVAPSTDVEERFAAGSELDLVSPDGERRRVEIARCAPHGENLRLSLVGFESREAVEPLRGATFEVSRARTPAAPEGEYYYFELIGCECSDHGAGPLGRVEEVVEDGGGLLLRVSDGSRTVLVPFVRTFLRSIDVAARKIELELPEGLIDTCAST